MKGQKVKLRLELTPGYEKRFTEACCRVLAKRNRQLAAPAAAGTAGKGFENEKGTA